MAAHRCGITKIVIPKANVKDLDDIPEMVKRKRNFYSGRKGVAGFRRCLGKIR